YLPLGSCLRGKPRDVRARVACDDRADEGGRPAAAGGYSPYTKWHLTRSGQAEATAGVPVGQAGALIDVLAEQRAEEHDVEAAGRPARLRDVAEHAVHGLDRAVLRQRGLVAELVEDAHDLAPALQADLALEAGPHVVSDLAGHLREQRGEPVLAEQLAGVPHQRRREQGVVAGEGLVAGLGERVGPAGSAAGVALAVARHEAVALEDRELLGDGGTADPEGRRQLLGGGACVPPQQHLP